ncbi:uncharacterized protein EV420DRAFT_1036291 [Desarmillaria tabescens]|uniref:Uncharacterized protein n=1 Tax=Armillaria tabescens TaxID=1929756 RepID=A0AA39NET4_ARMTA|nr:uncharacterized protein EV420DRAFT_1036291 [Desarmillaria tabescens]KAK0464304.1 hypothetical protein EV420DRAFT_1036291 [Desarmillaria tabescens]
MLSPETSQGTRRGFFVLSILSVHPTITLALRPCLELDSLARKFESLAEGWRRVMFPLYLVYLVQNVSDEKSYTLSCESFSTDSKRFTC